MSTIVLVEARVVPHALDAMRKGLAASLPDTRAFDGCQGIDAYESTDEDGLFVLYERWDSTAHYERYVAWRTETGFLGRLGSMLSEPASIRYFERVEA